jgi:hypothetical protein
MARIPVSNYAENNLNTYRLSMMGGDDYSSNMGDSGMQAWAQQAQSYRAMYLQYLHQLSQGGVDPSEQSAYATVQGYLQQLNGWLSEYGMDSGSSGGWDPMTGDMGGYSPMMSGTDGGMGVPQSQQTNLGFDVSFQDQNHIVTEDGQAVIDASRNNSETRTIDAYQKNVTINAGSSANVTVARQPDDSVPGKTMFVVTINYPNGGPSRTIKLHNAERDGLSWNLAVDPSQVTGLDSLGDLKTKLNVSTDGTDPNAQTTHPNDTVPDSTSDPTQPNTTIFNNSRDVDYHVFDSNNPNIDITAPGTITLHGQSFGDKVQIVNYDATNHEWTIKFYKNGDDSQCKTITIHGDVNTKVILDVMGQSSVIGGFIDHSPLPETDTTKLASVQIGASGSSNGTSSTQNGPINPNHSDDSVPSHVGLDAQGNNTATYDENSDPTITNYFETGAPTNYEITASGTVTINPSRQSDQFHITAEQDPSDHVMKYKIVATGVDENGQSHTVTYWVKADQVHKIVIANVDSSQVTFGDSSQISDTQKAKIQVGNESDNATSDNSILQAFETALGNKTDAQILAALNSNGFHFNTINDLNAAMNATPPTFPPAFSTTSGSDFENLVKAIYALDGQFSSSVNALHGDDGGNYITNARPATQRLVALLQALYPDHNISVTYTNTNDNNWQHANDITFDGNRFNYSKEDNNAHYDQIAVSEVTGDT